MSTREIHFFNLPEDKSLLPIYPMSLGPDYKQRKITREKGYMGYQWLQTISGKGKFIYNNKSFELSEGHGIFIDKVTVHKYYPISARWKTAWIVFDGNHAEDVLNYMGFKYFNPYLISDNSDFNSMFSRLKLLAKKNTKQDFMEASTLFYNFLFNCGKSLLDTDTTIFSRYRKLEPVIDYINKNYNKDLPLDILASLIDITPQHLCVVFKDITGLRPTEFINNVRMSRAKELLQGTDYSIEQIAMMCGFDSTSYFHSLFKKTVGITPGKFRGNM